MNKTSIIIQCTFLLVSMCIAGIWGYGIGASRNVRTTTYSDTVLYTDTIPYYKPVPVDSVVVKYVTKPLPIAKPKPTETEVEESSRDSAEVIIPITQKVYEGEDYKAYVSGYETKIDSIFVYPQKAVITNIVQEREPPPRWHIGITGGYGYGFKSQQLEPFIGIGITYSFISF